MATLPGRNYLVGPTPPRRSPAVRGSEPDRTALAHRDHALAATARRTALRRRRTPRPGSRVIVATYAIARKLRARCSRGPERRPQSETRTAPPRCIFMPRPRDLAGFSVCRASPLRDRLDAKPTAKRPITPRPGTRVRTAA